MIKVNDLTIKYEKEIIKNLSYEFKNEIYLLYGENGSGKSSLFKAILNIIKYNGDVKIEGEIFYVPEKIILPKSLKIKDFLKSINALTKGNDMIDYYLNRYKLKDLTFNKCSKGMLQKVVIIASLICDYNILIYDEPFEGLDKFSKKLFIDDLKQKKNCLILISLHEDIKINAKKIKISDGVICEI